MPDRQRCDPDAHVTCRADRTSGPARDTGRYRIVPQLPEPLTVPPPPGEPVADGPWPPKPPPPSSRPGCCMTFDVPLEPVAGFSRFDSGLVGSTGMLLTVYAPPPEP